MVFHSNPQIVSLGIMFTFFFLLFVPSLKADCPPNSHNVTCLESNGLTCQNLYYGDNLFDSVSSCEPGCQCNEGYIRNATSNECVLPNQCSTIGKCGINAEFNFCVQCGGAGLPTCSSYGQPEKPIACRIGCLAGCFCKSGYFYDEIRKRCVLPRHCSCEGNQVFVLCKSGMYSYNEKCGCQCMRGTYDYTLKRCVVVKG